jgi:hypothetical protein
MVKITVYLGATVDEYTVWEVHPTWMLVPRARDVVRLFVDGGQVIAKVTGATWTDDEIIVETADGRFFADDDETEDLFEYEEQLRAAA